MIESYRVLGVRIDAVQIPQAVEQIRRWASEDGAAHLVCATGMHGVTEAQHARSFRDILNGADLNVADGWPVMYLGRLLGHPMRRRVYGPELMKAVMEATPGMRHFFYGGAPGVAEDLAQRMRERYGIEIAGTHTPPFEPVASNETPEVLEKINRSKADFLWVGLSTPKQESWMTSRRKHLAVPVMIGVGAAFDFHTGRIRQAPSWMQENGLEWLFRLLSEPRRLWKRYLVQGPEFVIRLLLEIFTGGHRRGRIEARSS